MSKHELDIHNGVMRLALAFLRANTDADSNYKLSPLEKEMVRMCWLHPAGSKLIDDALALNEKRETDGAK